MADELRKLSRKEAAQWMIHGKAHSADQKYLVVDENGEEVLVLLGPEEYRALMAALKLMSDPRRMFENGQRVGRIRANDTSSIAEFFGGLVRGG